MTAYEAHRVTARSKRGRIQRQRVVKLRMTKYLKTAARADFASVQFAWVHHYGLHGHISRKDLEVRYAERRLLSVNDGMETVIPSFC